jgi:hypothetical protein
MRGRVAPSVPPVVVGHATAHDAKRLRDTGLNDPADPDALVRAAEYVDEKMDVSAPAMTLGRQLGVEAEVQAEFGQFLTGHGQQRTLKDVWEDGFLPSGERTTPLKQNFDIFAAATPEEQRIADEGLKALNVLNEVAKGRQRSADELQAAAREVQAKPNDPEAFNRFRDANRVHRMWQTYEPAVRRYEPDRSEAQWQARIDAAMDNPRTLQLLENYKQINETKNWMLLEGGIINRAEFDRRMKEEPYHIALIDQDPKSGGSYDPTIPRTERFGRVDIPVFDIDAPMATARQSIEIATRASSNEIGKRNAIESMSAADPHGRELQVMPVEAAATHKYGFPVHFKDRFGKDMVAKFAKQSVADAFNQTPIDDGIAVGILNSVRNISQLGMVHGAAAVGQAPVSLFYNIVTGFLGQRAGTSIGYISSLMRMHTTKDSAVDKLADLVEVADITKIPAYAFTAVEAAALKTARSLGAKAATQAKSQDGFFGLIARSVPNGEQVVAKFGADLYDYYTRSWMLHYQRWAESGANPNVFDRNALRSQVQADLKTWAKGTPRGILHSWGGIKPIFNGINAILNHVGSLHNMVHVAQQVSIEEARRGWRLGPNEGRVIAEQARISAGDMAAQPGGTALRVTGKAVPFFRIGLASFRYLTHAMTARGSWDSGLVITRMGAVAGAMYAASQTIGDMGLTNWYYETLNDFERNGKLPVPKIQNWIDRIKTGQWRNLHPDDPANNFYMLNLPQEAALHLGTIMYGLEQAGFVNRGSNRGNTSAEKDMIYAALQTFNVGNVPALSLLGSAMGSKIDLAAGAKGKETISKIQGSRGQLGDMPSGIPMPVAEAIKSMLGFTGQLAVQSTDAGLQAYKKTHDAVAATSRAWDEASNIWLEKSMPSVPGLWEADKKVYGFTAMSQELSRMRGVAKELEDAFQNNFTAAGAKRGENRKRITDPQIKQMLAVSHVYFERGALPKLQERLTLLRNQVDNEAAAKGTKNYEDVKTSQRRIYKEMRPWYDRMENVVQKYERLLEQRYGDRFRAEDLEPNIDNVVKLVKKYSG